jgi:hypothetical protein
MDPAVMSVANSGHRRSPNEQSNPARNSGHPEKACPQFPDRRSFIFAFGEGVLHELMIIARQLRRPKLKGQLVELAGEAETATKGQIEMSALGHQRFRSATVMSALSQKQTYALQLGMSADERLRRSGPILPNSTTTTSSGTETRPKSFCGIMSSRNQK